MKKEIIREYSNGEITIVWQPAKCIHLKRCWKELPEVFDPDRRPWVDVTGASTERLIAQVERCYAGALSYRYNDKKNEKAMKNSESIQVSLIPGGPIVLEGEINVTHEDGRVEHLSGHAAFCRCGKTKNPPYCDGSHSH
jgi:uncharacterized Fe-S cluster protein YjdI